MFSISKLAVITAILFLSACSTTHKVQVIHIGNDKYTQAQFNGEIKKIAYVEKEIEAQKKEISPAEVASYLLWIPKIIQFL